MLDDRCRRIYSIDKRPEVQPDERGFDWNYKNNSTTRMIENLKKVSSDRIEVIETIDGDTREIDPRQIGEKVDVCFIDGEHTDEAVISDFKFCLRTLRQGSGAIIFHDAQITYNGIAECVKQLQEQKAVFRAYVLPHIVFVIEIGDFPIHKHPAMYERLVSNHTAYLFSLQNNDHYRRFANRAPFRFARNLKMKLLGSNVSH